MKKAIIIIIAFAGISTVVLSIVRPFGKQSFDIALEISEVIRGDISDLITSTGTLEALETVEVGTQVSGIIDKIYVDYNSVVKKGQLLAKIDETPLLAQLEQSQASVESAEAEADYQAATYKRYKALAEKKLIAQSDFDQVEYNYRKAKATLKNTRSVHEKNKINLAYATITSPIDGIILDRAVDEGQTVAASFNTPTLFTIANDLTEMQVEASVDEADIGRVKVGQRVEFTVDAYPELNFDGQVTQIRLQPVERSNVITYTVIIDAPNDELKLMPGMTANISFYVMEQKGIVLMPAEALSFIPDPVSMKAYLELHPGVEVKMPGEPGRYIWVKRGDIIEPVNVELGDTDELYYEVLSGLQEGDIVLTGFSKTGQSRSEMKAVNNEEGRSPFMPRPPGGGNPPPRN
jgi:HlyD family secretion protein